GPNKAVVPDKYPLPTIEERSSMALLSSQSWTTLSTVEQKDSVGDRGAFGHVSAGTFTYMDDP
ncbi:uncharacterized, partial [Tachysurus ichikawai]